MDPLAIVSLVTRGVGLLIQYIPKWIGASSDEERATVYAEAKAHVDALEAKFADADARDDAATAAARKAIADAEAGK